MNDVRKISDDIYNSIKNTISQVKVVDSSDGFDLKDVRAILTAVDMVVTEVERLSQDVSVGTLSGQDKKKIATEVLSRLLDFDIPWIPGVLEKTVKEKAINFAIDYSIEFLNRKFGKAWLQ